MRMPFNVQHSLTVGHWPKGDESIFQKNVQYSHPLSVGQVGDSHSGKVGIMGNIYQSSTEVGY